MSEETTDGQHIINVSVTNFMRIVEVNLPLNGKELSIKGKNKNGKTSLVESMRRAFEGGAAKKNKTPIRIGEEFAEVVIELDNMIVTWYMERDGKPKLKIMSKAGHYFKGPSAMMKELVGKLAYDPQAFMDLHPLDQKKIAISMLNTGEYDIDDLDLQREKAYDNRTASNRKAKEYETLEFGCGQIDLNTPTEEISIAGLSKELTIALAVTEEHNKELLQLARNNTRFEALKIEMDTIYQESVDLNTSIDNYEDPNVANIQSQIDGAERINETVRNAKQRAEYKAKRIVSQDKSAEYTNEINKVDKTKSWILENANLPVEGMGFNKYGITINEVPLADCSAAEQRELTMEMYFATAPTGKDAIKVVFIQDGSLFDEESLAHIKQLCVDKGFQLIIEIVGTSEGENQVIIEDGEVKQ